MRVQSSGAFALSVLLHGAVVLLIAFFSYAATGVNEDSPKILELVAGAGDAYAATAAPALGVDGAIKLQATPVAPLPRPPAPKPVDSPIQPVPLETVPSPAAAKPAKPVDLVAELKRVEARRERRLEAKYQKEKEAEEKRLAQERAQARRIAHIDAEGIREGVIGGSAENRTGGAGGKALTREESSELDAYFSLLKSRIKENHTPPEGVSDSLEARIEFVVSADGSLSQFRIVRSSGNHEFDRSVIEACERTRSIGARPDSRTEAVQMTFKMGEDESP